MITLTQLERFKATPLEELVAGNPSFQTLRRRQWPINWATHIFGAQSDSMDPKTAGLSLPSPNAVANLSQELADHEHAVRILAAKVRRDATNDPHDQTLVSDLKIWLSSSVFTPDRFRWERHEQELAKDKASEAWKERSEQLRAGTSEVLILLSPRLSELDASSLWREYRAKWAMDRFPASTEEERSLAMVIHAPAGICLKCGGEWHSLNKDHKACFTPKATVLVDPGDIGKAMSLIPRKDQPLVLRTRFKVPKETFAVPKSGQLDSVLPNMLSLDLSRLNTEQKDSVEKRVAEWVVRSRRNLIEGHRPIQLIRPFKNSRRNCLLIAGEDLDRYSWGTPWKDSLDAALDGLNVVATYFGPDIMMLR